MNDCASVLFKDIEMHRAEGTEASHIEPQSDLVSAAYPKESPVDPNHRYIDILHSDDDTKDGHPNNSDTPGDIQLEPSLTDSLLIETCHASQPDKPEAKEECNNRVESPGNGASCESLGSSPTSLSSLASLTTKEAEEAGGRSEGEATELRKLCIHLQSVLDQQLKERERLQQKNEELSQQVRMLKEPSGFQRESSESSSKSTENASLKKELEAARMILETQGSKFNKEMASLTSSYTAKLDNLTRLYEECKKEKESMVVRYAQAESRNIELQESWKRAEAKMKECIKEKDSAMGRWNALKMENNRVMKLLDAKDSELASMRRDREGQKEASNSREQQIKFLQQKVKREQEALKDAKEKIQEVTGQMAAGRVDCECLLNELKALVQANQMLQITGSLPTLSQVTNRIELVIAKNKEEATSKENGLWTDIFENLGSLAALTNNLMMENVSLKEKVKRVSQELEDCEENLDATRKRLEESEEERKRVELSLEEAESKCQEMTEETKELRASTERTTELAACNDELRTEMETQAKRHSECLDYANKLSQAYASIQADNISLNSEIESGNSEREKLLSKCSELEVENKHLIEQRFLGFRDLEEKAISLERQLEQKTMEYNLLQVQFSEIEDDLKSLRRQSGARIKDLTRQLNKLNKNLSLTSPSPEYDSSGSSNFSDNGLMSTPNHHHQLHQQPHHHHQNHPVVQSFGQVPAADDSPEEAKNSFVPHGARPITKRISFELDLGHCPPPGEGKFGCEGRSSEAGPIAPRGKAFRMQDMEVMCDEIQVLQNCESTEVGYSAPPSVRVVEVNRQMFVDKIVSLQKTLAKKNERLDFLQELNSRLSQDIASKARIIQNYILREETGVMSSNQSDRLKQQIARRGGIMASLFSSHSQDEAMTVDLALEISHKLQSVLEDTLLKNIAFKESMELLGKQVAKLTKENESLKSRNPS